MKQFAVEVVRKQTSSLTRVEIHDVVLSAVERSKVGRFPISKGEGYQLSLDELEVLSPGISDNVESITVYLESSQDQDGKGSAAGGGAGDSRNLVINGNGIINGGRASAPQSQRSGSGTGTQEEEGEESGDDGMNGGLDVEEVENYFSIYVYELDLEGEEAEYMEEKDEEEGQSAASHHWLLPSRSFHGMWDSLIFEADIKCKLVDYVKTAVMFSSKGVNPALVSWNKVILLHGPPGTGKTSLCKALAQKAVIRLQNEFLYGQLIEINSHSLFSKWFSESGKLVTKMFDKILELVEDPQGLVFLLIDEVESLAQCRQSAEMGNEPTDSIRAVNALLTQIDRIKKYPNVLILTTSNIVGSIDVAFVDRADLKIYIGHPPASIIYGILASCINELLRVGLITNNDDCTLPLTLPEGNRNVHISTLLQISVRAKGLSGRSLRKLPFLTYANYYGKNTGTCDLNSFLEAMSTAVDKELLDRHALNTQCAKATPASTSKKRPAANFNITME